ncbi:cell adhesion molecule-related/down-regulated by oncogenes isoform X1 [Xenopus tropicalis]|uniref:Cell adhesion molecule-related/down-regulated by oncogenes n=1 Tax=Xenopus tropicalis TaxID=8364 RepID=A0A6I8RS61_XENTR|nr:cell adhesion molecule-related/down-regulated by oncogenes isoform X1 [Xenopus tropicalis]XP_031762021.1 cell adhesion molecule-related/down-regulated by oncogenes isoform X1 [Xenopus tropicalis]
MHPDPRPWHPLLCFLVLVVSTSANSDVTPHFTSEPLSTVQKLGGPVTLLCTAEPPWAHISWLFNGELLERISSQGVDIQSGHLTIPSLGTAHIGQYQCIASTSVGAILSRPATVSVAYLNDFETTIGHSVTAEEGSSEFIGCKIPESNPKAHVRYKVRGKWLKESSVDKYLILPSGNLHILNVSLEDRGTYRCAAYNPVTHELKPNPSTVKLSVNRSPQVDSHILHPVIAQTVLVQIHDPLTLECVVGGVPNHSQVYWYKGGKEAEAYGRRKLLHTHLVIEQVQRSDAGNYSCVFDNGSGVFQRVNYTLTVLEPPSISQKNEDQSLIMGSNVRFSCESRGNPSPNITWFHNAVQIHPSAHHQISGNKLRITNLIAEDSGIYQCFANNGVGSAQVSQRLTVKSETWSKPVIVSPPTSIRVANGDLVTLTCNATGIPTPTIRWYDSHGPISSHPSQVLRSKPRKALMSKIGNLGLHQDPVHLIMSQAGSSSLYIRAITVQHSGKYTCEATNEFGSAHADAFLTVVPYEMSTKPEDITPLDLTQSDEGDYDSETRAPSHSQLNEHEPESRVTEKPYSGASLPEAPIILSPPQTTKPDMYNLMWRSGKDGGLPINAYFVRYRKLDDDGNMVGNWNSIRVPASENEFPLTELESSSLYEVLMVARNAAGEGQPAMLTFRTSKERSSSSKNTQAPFPPIGDNKQTVIHGVSNSNFGLVPMDPSRHSGVPEAPDRPTISTASETSVYVTWIPRANGGSPITSFKVEYKRTGGHWNTASENIPPSKLSVEVSNLEPGGLYKFRVIAINNYGESRRSTVSRPYQVAGYSSRLPNPLIVGPRIDQTEAVTDTQILLKWTYIPENNNNTPIQGFYIYYRPTDSDNDSDYKRDMVEGTKQRHLISHLQPETSYDIKMQCFNERGASDYSNVMMCETKARRGPGASEYPVLDLSTPSVPDRSSSPSHSPARSGDFLYVIVGCVLGGMVLILMAFIAMCLLKNRQQTLMQKFEPPGYLYQGADLNGQIIEYTTLPGTSRINGSVHTGFMGNGNLNNGCPHIHHKVHNRASGVGNGEMYPGCNSSLKETYVDYERLPHHLSNGRVMYTALPQTDPTECINCRNCCNNNRCFTKPNGSYCGNGVAVMPVGMAPQQDEGETNPLNHVMVPMCLTSPDQRFSEEIEEDHNEKETQLSTNSICVEEATQTETEQQEGEDCNKTEGDSSILTWAPLILPAISKDCNEKHSWTSTDNTLDKSNADQPQLQTQEA